MSKPAEGAKSGNSEKQKKAGESVGGSCTAMGCKHVGTRFNFCEEHYDHFKFGLIKKDGNLVPDYEKKLGHYLAMKAKRSAHKVA
jgi:hypothetical protein